LTPPRDPPRELVPDELLVDKMARSVPLDWQDSDGMMNDFEQFLKTVTYSERNPLNTEAFYLWCMVRRDQPEQFIESGTFKGYSATFLCEALAGNSNNPSFTTIGYDLENCLIVARDKLAKYEFAEVVEGDSFLVVDDIQDKSKPTAFFIDGPKGKNLRPLLEKLFEIYSDIVFIAIHDAEKESGSGNRKIALSFENQCDVFFCGADFQERYRHLDEPLFDVMPEDLWRPYRLKGKDMESYGSETAFIVPNPEKKAQFLAQKAEIEASKAAEPKRRKKRKRGLKRVFEKLREAFRAKTR